MHELVLDNGEHERKLFYKLPEQLERHYKKWLQARGQRATLVNTTHMRSPATSLLSNPNRHAHVLPPVPLLTPGLQNTPLAQAPQMNKGKGKERVDSSSGVSNC